MVLPQLHPTNGLWRAFSQLPACLSTFVLYASMALNVTPALAQGAPEDAASAFTSVSSALLGLEFSSTERMQLRHLLDGYWQRQDRRSIDSVLATRDFAAKLASHEPEPRAVALRMSRPDTLLNLQADADRGDAVSRWLLQRYAERHPTLARARPGGLPLTRDSVDGQLDLTHFMATEIHRHPARQPNAAERETAYRAAAARHAQLSPEAQVQLARAPGEAARLRFGWQRANPMDRLLGRAELGGKLTPQEQQQVQQFMAGLNAQLQGLRTQQQTMLTNSLANMRQNSETIMGRGTVWNPATHRWEQQGGIVTEFNGTVRVP